MPAATQLAEHFATLTADRLPEDQRHQARRLLLDYLGVALAGSRADSGRIVAEFVAQTGGDPQATVLGHGARVPAMHAAFANAVAEHSIELDDVDELALYHYGPPVVSAALAVGQWRRASGAELLTAIVAGCEMMARLSQATNPALRDRGFHTTPVCGVFGAAVAAGVLLRLSAEQLTSALGLAGAQASGLMEMYGPSMQKRLNPGPAARDGVTAAVLAGMGYTGADTILDGERGVGAAFAGQLDRDALLDGLGSTVPVIVEHKAYSAARPIHTVIDAALALRDRVAPDRVSGIVVERHPAWAHYHLNASPTSFHEAQVSLPWSVAVALVDGAALPAQYADDRLADPRRRALSELVEVRADAALPDGVSCRLHVQLDDGTRLRAQVDHPRGSVQNPLTDEDLLAKARTLTTGLLPSGAIEAVARQVQDLDALADVNDLVALLDGAAA